MSHQSKDREEFYKIRELWLAKKEYILKGKPDVPQVVPSKPYNLYTDGPEEMPRPVIEVCKVVALTRLQEIGLHPPEDMLNHFAYSLQRKGTALFVFKTESLLTTLERVEQ